MSDNTNQQEVIKGLSERNQEALFWIAVEQKDQLLMQAALSPIVKDPRRHK